jgi:hypothetical protein
MYMCVYALTESSPYRMCMCVCMHSQRAACISHSKSCHRRCQRWAAQRQSPCRCSTLQCAQELRPHVCTYVSMYLCMYVCLYVCMCTHAQHITCSRRGCQCRQLLCSSPLCEAYMHVLDARLTCTCSMRGLHARARCEAYMHVLDARLTCTHGSAAFSISEYMDQ